MTLAKYQILIQTRTETPPPDIYKVAHPAKLARTQMRESLENDTEEALFTLLAEEAELDEAMLETGKCV